MSEEKRKKSSIYTRTGDKGQTSLFNGKRRPKNDIVFDALGTIDELNAHIGLAREYCQQAKNGIDQYLIAIQSRCFDIGAAVATPIDTSSEEKLRRTEFKEKNIQDLELWIDTIDNKLPKLTHFILPSGGLASSQLHICRAVCRRAERLVVTLVNEGQVDDVVQRYLNRLSDFFFVVARAAAQHEGKKEVEWIPQDK